MNNQAIKKFLNQKVKSSYFKNHKIKIFFDFILFEKII